MTCDRPGCNSEVPSGRRKYCSTECSRAVNRMYAAMRARERYMLAAQLRNTRVKVRCCLACGDEFLSEGPWNRICPVCSERNGTYSPRSRGVSMDRRRDELVQVEAD